MQKINKKCWGKVSWKGERSLVSHNYEKISINNLNDDEKENKGSKNVTKIVLDFPQEYDINNNKNKKLAIDTIALKALKVMQNVSTDFNLNSWINYINFSVYDVSAEFAPEALLVMQNVSIDGGAQLKAVTLTDVNKFINNNYINVSEKNKMGSNRVIIEPNRLIPSYNTYNKQNYLNISVDSSNRARMAEWLLRLVDTQWPYGLVGSIPTPSVTNNSNKFINKIKEVII